MWQRRTFHECASELRQISEQFRAAYTNKWRWDGSTRDRMLRDTSTRGVEKNLTRVDQRTLKAEMLGHRKKDLKS